MKSEIESQGSKRQLIKQKSMKHSKAFSRGDSFREKDLKENVSRSKSKRKREENLLDKIEVDEEN